MFKYKTWSIIYFVNIINIFNHNHNSINKFKQIIKHIKAYADFSSINMKNPLFYIFPP